MEGWLNYPCPHGLLLWMTRQEAVEVILLPHVSLLNDSVLSGKCSVFQIPISVMWCLGTHGASCELMEERNTGARVPRMISSGSHWTWRIPVLVTTMMQLMLTTFESSSYTNTLCLDPGPAFISPLVPLTPSKSFWLRNMHEGRVTVLSSFILPTHFTIAPHRYVTKLALTRGLGM